MIQRLINAAFTGEVKSGAWYATDLDPPIFGADNSVVLEGNHKEHFYEGRPRFTSVRFAADT